MCGDEDEPMEGKMCHAPPPAASRAVDSSKVIQGRGITGRRVSEMVGEDDEWRLEMWGSSGTH